MKLQQREDFYNLDRPHGALGGQTLSERLRQKIGDSSVTGLRQSHNRSIPLIKPSLPLRSRV